MPHPRLIPTLALVPVLALAACGPESPTDVPDFVLESAFNDVPEQPTGSWVRVCKFSYNDVHGLPDDGTIGTVFNFTTTATNPTVVAPSASMPAMWGYELNPYRHCPVVWNDPNSAFDDQTLVSVTEELTTGFALADIAYEYPLEQMSGGYDRQGGRTITLPPRGGLIVYFKNVAVDTPPPPPPPTGGQGCTPGYWRQPHHYDSWTVLTPDDTYSAVFGVGPDMRLGDAIKIKGGKFNALIRHSTAAMLNAYSPGVDYDLTASDVVTAVQNAYSTGAWKNIKNQLDNLNNQGCPLN